MATLAVEKLRRIATMTYISPVIVQLRILKQQRPNDSITIPSDDVICIRCPAAKWKTTQDKAINENRTHDKVQDVFEPTCFCRPEHRDVWSREEPDMVTMCDEPVIQAEDALIKLEQMKVGLTDAAPEQPQEEQPTETE